MLDAERLRRLVGADSFLEVTAVHNRIDSTNDEVRRLADAGAPEGTVVLAAEQEGGRGSHGRRWYSPPGTGLYLSVLFRPQRPARELTRWTLAAAVAAAEGCRAVAEAPVEVEWPNDIVWSGRKLGGILTETRTSAGRSLDLVCGIGLNLLDLGPDAPPEVRERATSLQQVAGGRMLEAETTAAEILRRLARLGRRLERGSWGDVAARWERLAPRARGSRVRVTAGDAGGFGGRTRGLAVDGALVVERDDGSVSEVRMVDAVTYVEG